RSVKMYVYPKRETLAGPVLTVETMPIAAGWRHLRDFLLESGHLVPIQRYDESLLSIYTKDVLARIQSGDASWQTMVPPAVADPIRTKSLFGLKRGAASDAWPGGRGCGRPSVRWAAWWSFSGSLCRPPDSPPPIRSSPPWASPPRTSSVCSTESSSPR